MFLSKHIQNKMPAITSEHSHSEEKFQREFKAKISPYNQSFKGKKE